MAFNADKFTNTKYKDRVEEVKVPELKNFFDEGEEPVWVVRALPATQVAIANQEVHNNLDVSDIVSSLHGPYT